MEKRILNEAKSLILIAAAALIYAVGISLFLDPNQLAPGGVTGIAVILNRLVPIETGTLYFLLNVPIVILGIWKFGVRLIAKTAYAIVLVSMLTNLLGSAPALTEDLLIAGAVGGGLTAVGIGLIFKAGATTGGTDIIIKILRLKYRHLKTGFLFLCTDIVIVSMSALVFRNIEVAFYALLTVMVSGKVLDYVLYGGDNAKMLFIMTREPEKIGKRLMKELEVGVTYLHGQGGWTGEEREVVFSMVPNRLGAEVQDIVKQEDSSAFLVVTSANEIYGEGYKDFFEEII